MSKFKVGDRVAVYNHNSRSTGEVIFVGTSTQEIDIALDAGFSTTVRRQQCRKLKPKPKKKFTTTATVGDALRNVEGYLEFREPHVGKKCRITVEVLE